VQRREESPFVVTDGEDNASRDNLEESREARFRTTPPTVYTIGILGKDREQKRARRAWKDWLSKPAGVALLPQRPSVSGRNLPRRGPRHSHQYTIGYKPAARNPRRNFARCA